MPITFIYCVLTHNTPTLPQLILNGLYLVPLYTSHNTHCTTLTGVRHSI